MVQKFERLSWRYCILMEEHYGTQACVINLHNLIHFHEDISRFSAPDNYWCTQFERAVSRYVRQSSNKKYLEKTFARKESQREFLKFQQSAVHLDAGRPSRSTKFNREKVTKLHRMCLSEFVLSKTHFLLTDFNSLHQFFC